ncbi:MAG: nicotinamidase, partial [Acidobacteriaceae bacterium]|nr:nicotinamidase [Acidobacteriaceae bacterium]
LIIIDMQKDFLPGGALAVDKGDEIIAPIEGFARKFEHVVLTADWHPRGHISFASSYEGLQPNHSVRTDYGEQQLWPEHCIQNTPGAEFGVDIPHAGLVLRKGTRPHLDSYSAFLENDHMTPTGLAGYLRERQLTRLFLCGLAFDYCVGSSAVDATKMGFEVLVLEDLSRAIAPESTATMRERFAKLSIQCVHSDILMKK